jgi:hypothetical protein
MSSSGGRPVPSYVGLYDPNILCQQCDGELGKLDQHAAEKLVRGTREKLHLPTVDVWRYDQAHPRTLIRFLASVAWRASVSSLPYFARVRLGPYENKLRSISMGEIEPTPDFACLLSEYDLEEVAQLNPTNTRLGDLNFIVLYAHRFAFYMKLDKRPLPLELREASLAYDRPVLSIVRPWTATKEFKLLAKVVKANPKPAFWKQTV